MNKDESHPANTETEDIAAQQQQIIESQRAQLKELTQQLEHYKSRSDQYDEICNIVAASPSQACMCPNCHTQFQIPTSFMNAHNVRQSRINSNANMERAIKDQELAVEQAAREAERQARLEERVLNESPWIQQDLDKTKADLDNDVKESIELVNRFFSMSEEDYVDYLNHKHTLEESSVQLCIRYDASRVAKYFCQMHDDNTFTIGQIESHIHANAASHKEFILNEINKNHDRYVADATTKYKQEIAKEIIDMQQRDANKILTGMTRQEKDREKKLRERLPLIKD